MDSLIKTIGNLVETLGTPGFDVHFFELYNEIIGITQCTVFEFPTNAHVRKVLAVGINPALDNSAKTLAYDYIHGFFKEDPIVRALSLSDAEELPVWKTFEPHEIENQSYRQKFYDQPHLVHELNLQFKNSQHMIIASLYRSALQGKFLEEDALRANQFIELSLKLLDRHIELLQPEFCSSREATGRRYHKLLDLLIRYELSAREAEICALILLGHTTNGIALNLDISINTVSTHRKRAYAKLGIATQNELFCRCFDVLNRELGGTADSYA